MSSLENTSQERKQPVEQHVPLIYGLPDDLSLLCLSRIPRQYHNNLRCVSRRWRALLCSEEWHSCRNRQNLKETWIYAMCRSKYRGNVCYVLDPYPSRRDWKPLRTIPSGCVNRQGMCFESLGNKLYLLGGGNFQDNATNEVYCYDASTKKWEEAACMPNKRCFSVSSTLENKIYVTGGLGMSLDLLPWEIYDHQSNNWTSQRDPSCIGDIAKIFTFDSKVYIIHKTWSKTGHYASVYDRYARVYDHYARVYDPLTGEWKHANKELASCAHGPTVDICGTLYMLDETFGTRLLMWQKDSEQWMPLGRLAPMLTKPPCQLVAIGRSIFVIGQNLSTVVVDLDQAEQAEGVLVCSSFAPSLENDLSVISCKTTSI